MINIQPQISIIMATYNRAHFIAEMLTSIQNQSYTNFECIIIDDGGTDHTPEVVAPFIKDARFSFQKRLDSYTKGLPGCRNYGLDLATGHYIIFFDDDDLVHPDCLRVALESIEINPSFTFCHYQKQSFKKVKEIVLTDVLASVNSQETTGAILYEVITGVKGFASCTVLWKAACFKDIRFVESLKYAEEWECYTRILSANYKGVIIDAITYFNRKHPASNTGEFYNGDSKRVASKIDACNLIISNLNEKKMLSAKIQKFFTWEAVQLQTFTIVRHLREQSSVSGYQKVKATLLYTLSPLIKIYLRSKKN